MEKITFQFNPETDLRLERIVPVSAEDIHRHWTSAERMDEWFCPLPWKVSWAELDARPGGKFNSLMEGPNGEQVTNSGCLLHLVPNRQLVFTSCLGEGFRPTANSFMTACIDLEPVEGGTRYTATVFHKDSETKEEHAAMGFEQGWGVVLDQLVALIESGK
ncbi:MAG: SRPBCC family protein [Armatimonadetes bacterium]|nr:SRPBCC family protein [Armatimonadota bacterium]